MNSTGWPKGQVEGFIPVDGGSVLYHCGEYDSGTPEAAAYYNAKTPNGELCILPSCAHNASTEKPEEFNAVVSAFADRISCTPAKYRF